jgi:hypothetical protein
MNFAIMRFLSFLFGFVCAAEQALRAAQRGGFQDQLRLPRSVRKERRQLANLSIQWRRPIGERDAKDMTGHDMQSPPSLLLHFCYFIILLLFYYYFILASPCRELIFFLK